MIKVTRLNKQEYYINSDLIETIESTPDTVITLLNGKKSIVAESADDIIEKIISFRSRIRISE